MIAVEQERARSETAPGFFDSVSIDFCDAEHEVFGMLRLTRFPNEGRAAAIVLLLVQGDAAVSSAVEHEQRIPEWERAQLAGLTLATAAPLEHWSVAFERDGARVELDARALSPPLDRAEAIGASVGRAAGTTGYEQLCELHGSVTAGGDQRAVSCTGRRTHEWGVRDWQRLARWRSLYAASEEQRAVTVVAALPAGSAGHGEELRAGHLLGPDREPLALEEVRVSTVFGATGLPEKAGLELFRPGDELPSRAAGEALCSGSLELPAEKLTVSFFRWSLDGSAALGAYEALVPS